MKHTLRWVTAVLLTLTLVVTGLPMTMAAAASYTTVDYSSRLTEKTPWTQPLLSTDPLISMNCQNGWTGYAKGCTVTLTGGVEYLFTAEMNAGDATYCDRGIALLKNTLTGKEETDLLASSAMGDTRYSSSTLLYFTPPADGDYRVLTWGYCHDSKGQSLFGENATVTLEVEKVRYFSSTVDAIDIHTVADWMALPQTLSGMADSSSVTLRLQNNLDFTGKENFSLSPSLSEVILDGNSYTLSGLNAPLFEKANELTVNNLTLELDIRRTGDGTQTVSALGGLVGTVEDSLTLKNCYVTGVIHLENLMEAANVGGYGGAINRYFSAENCNSDVTITLKDVATVNAIGGFIGYLDASYSSRIKNSRREGDITLSGKINHLQSVGGMIGSSYAYSGVYDSTVTGTIDTTAVTGQSLAQNIGGVIGEMGAVHTISSTTANLTINAPQCDNVGGIAGLTGLCNTIINSSTDGRVIGNQKVGGLVGNFSNRINSNQGNLLANSYSSAAVTGNRYVAGLVGQFLVFSFEEPAVPLINCYTNGSVTPVTQADDTFAALANLQLTENVDPSATILQNCFTLDMTGLPGATGVTRENGTVTPVDSANTAKRKEMVDLLNQTVNQYNQGDFVMDSMLLWGQGTKETGPVLVSTIYGFGYTDYSYTTKLTPGKVTTLTSKQEDPLLEISDWEYGYAQGYSVDLTAGTEYLFQCHWPLVKGPYHSFGLLLLKDQLTGDLSRDVLKQEIYYGHSSENAMDGTNGDPTGFAFSFRPETSGNYKLIYLSNFHQNHQHDENQLFGRQTAVSLSIRAIPTAPVTIPVASRSDLASLSKTLLAMKDTSWVKIDLKANIDMTGLNYVTPILPITATNRLYRLEIEGNGHTIKGLNNALFFESDQLIARNLNLTIGVTEAPYVPNENYVNFGGLMARVGQATVENCRVSGSVSAYSKFRIEELGGILGQVTQSLQMRDCRSNVNITTNLCSNVVNLGGVVGYYAGEAADSRMENVHWNGRITLKDPNYDVTAVGGVIGNAISQLAFSNCSATGSITVTQTDFGGFYLGYGIGGFIGRLDENSTFDYCRTNVTISGAIGYGYGGFAGGSEGGNTFINCYAKGKLTAPHTAGGFIASSSGNRYVNCYTTVDVTAENRIGGFAAIVNDYDGFDWGDTFLNCYAAGNVTAKKPSAPENLVAGSFIGLAEYPYGQHPSAVTFENCYVNKSKTLSPCGHLMADQKGLNEISFADDAAVEQMTQTLNQSVERLNNRTDTTIPLLIWRDRNEKNGPMFNRMMGDVNGDDLVDAKDALTILKILVDKEQIRDTIQFTAADVSGEKELSAQDALLILKYSVGKITVFPAEE